MVEPPHIDLRTEQWVSVSTRFAGTLPHRENNVNSFEFPVVNRKLYNFGGDDDMTSLGCNIFMAFDLQTLEWEHISGTSANKPRIHATKIWQLVVAMGIPSYRTQECMVAAPATGALYLTSGGYERHPLRCNISGVWPPPPL